MNIIDLIEKKKRGLALDPQEIAWFVAGVTNETIPSYQASAFLMAVWFSGMTPEETRLLTSEMMMSGSVVDLSGISGITVDKHSTGGVGDKTTLVLIPMLAACGMKVAKMSGRGLGHTGGTVDKLEAIPGFKTTFDSDAFLSAVTKVGAVIASQSANVAPADKKMYALRDVTGSVDSIPLIASSVMSKKLACGAGNIVLDVKCGGGSFMKNYGEAVSLAESMVEIAKGMGRNASALITDMSQPLGISVGNSLEVMEAILTLKGEGEEDLRDLCIALGSELAQLGGLAKDEEEGSQMMKDSLTSGKALDVFASIVKNQGGDERVIDDFSLFKEAGFAIQATCEATGFVDAMDCEAIGRVSQLAGAGREVLGQEIDFSAGVILHKKIGDSVAPGETLAELFTDDEPKAQELALALGRAYRISKDAPKPVELILGRVR